jgi:glycosyltransferase involved in cell wall biosynthesis
MNVLYYLENFPKLSQSFVLNEISELERRGHHVAVFTLRDPDEAIQHSEHEDLDVPVRYARWPNITDAPDLLATKVLNSRVLRRSLYRAHPKHHARSLHFTQQCIEYVNELDWTPELVHCHFAHPNKLPATYATAYYGIPCTVTAHAYEIFRDPDRHMLRVLLDRTDRVVVPSEYNRSYLHERFGIGTPIDVVPATTRISKFEPTDGEVPNRLLTVARLVEKKGIVYAIEALARLRETHPNVTYHVVGNGAREDALQRRAAELGVGDRVTFLGNVSDERLHRELDEAAVFVLPSVVTADGDRDSSPVALKEAMAMATPCVSTTVAGIPEIIEHGSDGLLVEPRDSAALVDALATLFADGNSRQAMGRQARESVTAKFGIEAAVDGLEASFRAAMNRRKPLQSDRSNRRLTRP